MGPCTLTCARGAFMVLRLLRPPVAENAARWPAGFVTGSLRPACCVTIHHGQPLRAAVISGTERGEQDGHVAAGEVAPLRTPCRSSCGRRGPRARASDRCRRRGSHADRSMARLHSLAWRHSAHRPGGRGPHRVSSLYGTRPTNLFRRNPPAQQPRPPRRGRRRADQPRQGGSTAEIGRPGCRQADLQGAHHHHHRRARGGPHPQLYPRRHPPDAGQCRLFRRRPPIQSAEAPVGFARQSGHTRARRSWPHPG